MQYIKCNGLCLGYEDRIVTENINFEVNSGDYLCIIGENGVGKSTLIKALVGLNRPIKGSISYSADMTRKDIGYLPQHTVVQRDFPATVMEIVLTGTLVKGKFNPFYSANDRRAALSCMEKMGISNLAGKCYRDLSGGQQQRVLLARALCATEKLLVLDEPVTGLDPKVTCEFYGLLSELNKTGVTIVMVSHDLEETIGHASKILHLGKEQLFFGNKEDYLKTKEWHEFHEHHNRHCHNGGECNE